MLFNCFRRFYGREATEEQLNRVAAGYGSIKVTGLIISGSSAELIKVIANDFL